jgi:hypothetical protein
LSNLACKYDQILGIVFQHHGSIHVVVEWWIFEEFWSECSKHLYYFGITCCESNAFCVINYKLLRKWTQEFYLKVDVILLLVVIIFLDY